MAVKHVKVKYDAGDLKGYRKENIKEGMGDINVTKQRSGDVQRMGTILTNIYNLHWNKLT